MAEAKIRITALDQTGPAFSKALSNIDALKSSALGLAGVFGVGFSVAGLAAMATASLKSVDALNDLKDATGASIENISALEDVAVRTGSSFESVSTALIKFNKALQDAKPDNDAGAALKAIGLNAKELKNIDPAEALLKAAVALQGFANDGNKARLVQELFGKSLKEVAPLLKDLAEKGKLVATVTTDQAERAERLANALNSLGKSSQDAGRAILDGLAPAMAKLVENYNAMKSAGLLGTVLKDAAKSVLGLGDLSSSPGTDINALLEQRTALQTKYNKALEQGGLFNRKLFGKELGADIKAQIDQVNELLAVSRIRQAGEININSSDSNDALNRRLNRSKPTLKFDGAPNKDKKPKAEEISEARRELAQYVESLSKVLDKEKDLTAVEKALNFLRTQGVQGQIPQVRQLVLGLAEQIDLEEQLAERLKIKRNLSIEAGEAVNKSNEEYQALLSSLLEATPSAKLARQRSDVQLLTEEFQAGRIAETLYLEAVTARLDLAGEGVQQLGTFAARAAQNIQDALGDTLADVLQGNFSDIGASFTKMLNRMVAEAAAANVMEHFFGAKDKSGARSGGSLGGVFENLFTNLLGFEGGGSTGSGPRSGGVDGKGGFMAVLHPQETVIDHTKGQSASAGRPANQVNITVNQSFAPGTTRATTLQAAADARRQLEYSGRNL